jgi:hypothetical protein
LQHGIDTVGPDVLVRHVGRGVREDQAIDPLRRFGAEPHADHPAHREATPVDLLDLQRVQHCQHIAAEHLHVVRAGRHAGLAMPAPIIADEAEVLRQRRHLRVPHVQRGAERVRQHQHRLVLRSLNLDVDLAAVRLDGGHRLSPK